MEQEISITISISVGGRSVEIKIPPVLLQDLDEDFSPMPPEKLVASIQPKAGREPDYSPPEKLAVPIESVPEILPEPLDPTDISRISSIIVQDEVSESTFPEFPATEASISKAPPPAHPHLDAPSQIPGTETPEYPLAPGFDLDPQTAVPKPPEPPQVLGPGTMGPSAYEEGIGPIPPEELQALSDESQVSFLNSRGGSGIS